MSHRIFYAVLVEDTLVLPRLDVLQRIAAALDMRLTIDFVEVPAPRRRRPKATDDKQALTWAASEPRPSAR